VQAWLKLAKKEEKEKKENQNSNLLRARAK